MKSAIASRPAGGRNVDGIPARFDGATAHEEGAR
jgi:hypothetical protein